MKIACGIKDLLHEQIIHFLTWKKVNKMNDNTLLAVLLHIV